MEVSLLALAASQVRRRIQGSWLPDERSWTRCLRMGERSGNTEGEGSVERDAPGRAERRGPMRALMSGGLMRLCSMVTAMFVYVCIMWWSWDLCCLVLSDIPRAKKYGLWGDCYISGEV